MTTEARARFPLAMTIAALVSLAILLALGAWQLQRLGWKTALLAKVEALQAAAPVPIVPVLEALSGGSDGDYVRVTADCPALAQAPYLELYGIREGVAGVRLISACKLATGPYGSILVDRGFIPDTVSARPAVLAGQATPLQVTGVLRAGDRASFVTPPNDLAANHWYSRDIAAMAKALKAERPAPTFLMAETPTNPEFPALLPSPLPAEISNRHLEYALTWFGLAASLAGVYVAVLWRRRKS
jgi:surfeit locus 1 family protein